MAVAYGNLPFKEQINFFKGKVNLPTESWTDIWEGMHSRAFVVAGATKDALLVDLRSAVLKGISEGGTIQDFRKDFDTLVAKHGWVYNGGRNWRTRVIFDTNIRQSYNAGREAQMADPELRKLRPYGLYRHGGSEEPRPEHLALDGTVLPLDDPFWETWTPQNGWGCKCEKYMVSDTDVERMGLMVARRAPEIPLETVTVGTRGPSPRTVTVPKGIDPGFAYNPGTAAWGRQLSTEVMDGWRGMKSSAWERLTPGTWQSYGRPEKIPIDPTKSVLAKKLSSDKELQRLIAREIGGDEVVFKLPGGTAINVNAEALASHVDPVRAQYLPYLKELLTDPFEIWMAFEKHKGTGQVVLRTRVIKAIATGKLKGQLLVAQARKGQLEAWTVVPVQPKYLQRQREGKMIFGRE